MYRKKTIIYKVSEDSKLFTPMTIALEGALRRLHCEPIWSRDEPIDEKEIPKH